MKIYGLSQDQVAQIKGVFSQIFNYQEKEKKSYLARGGHCL